MNYHLRFRPEVVEDLSQGLKWYEDKFAGLGAEFLDECRARIERILAAPELAAPDYRQVRSVRLRRFPFIVHYRIEETTIVIIAILFGGRDPTVWRERL